MAVMTIRSDLSSQRYGFLIVRTANKEVPCRVDLFTLLTIFTNLRSNHETFYVGAVPERLFRNEYFKVFTIDYNKCKSKSFCYLTRVDLEYIERNGINLICRL